MKHALVPLLILSCGLFAQDKPAVEAPKPAADEKAAESKPKIPSINVRDELIVEIHALKQQISHCRERMASGRSYMSAQANQSSESNNYFNQARVQHESNITLLIESQRALLLALAELAKEAAKDKPTEVKHSRN
jgi:hypothetical protein